ncbi:hypothetical protein BDV93DRAFT_518699 [Ceratobasidium sp. AG-I]|nr:hypothetical protein BDV93DRAFT_518699 [Ceratobasidium sp. AG-I]
MLRRAALLATTTTRPISSHPTTAMVNKYIVVFKDGTPKPEIDKAMTDLEAQGGKVTQKLDLINGFAAEIPDAHLTSLQSFVGDKIDYIEPDGIVTTQ